MHANWPEHRIIKKKEKKEVLCKYTCVNWGVVAPIEMGKKILMHRYFKDKCALTFSHVYYIHTHTRCMYCL